MSAGDMSYKNYSNLFVYSGANKAGMGQIDKEKQAQIIYEMSKNSAYFKKAAKLDEVSDEKVKLIQASIDSISPHQETKLHCLVSHKSVELEKRRNFERICCVLDMDMFYAAVEIRDQPHLKDLPVAVGGDMMISTANYVARKYGVRAAMPGFVAKKLCPHLVFVNCNFSKYEKVAEQIRSIIGEYDPSYRSHSLDEVYFDLTKAAKKRYLGMNKTKLQNGENSSVREIEHEEKHVENSGNSIKANDISDEWPENILYDINNLRQVACVILTEIRLRIQETTNGLTASAGIANNFFLAKICADINKPDGQYELGPNRDSVMSFVTSLSTRKVGGIGKVTEKILSKLGMDSLGQVRDSIHKVLHSFSPISSEFLMRVSLGIAEEEGMVCSSVVPPGAVTRKSIGCERTFNAKGISDTNELIGKLTFICGNVSKDMAGEDLWGRTVTLKLKTVTFDLLTRSASSKQFIQSAQDIERLARQLLDQLLPVNIRLMGVSVSKFKNAYDPLEAESRGQKNVLQYFQQWASTDASSSSSEPPGVIILDSEDERTGGHSRGGTSVVDLDSDGFPCYDPLLYGADGEHTAGEDSWDTYSNLCSNPSCMLVEEGPDEAISVSNSQSLFEAVVSSSQCDLLNYSHQQQQRDKKVAAPPPSAEEEAYPVIETASIASACFSSNSSRSNNLSEKLTCACPICGTEIYGTLVAVNTHIDGCLSGPGSGSVVSGKSCISSYFQTRNSSVIDLLAESDAHDRLLGSSNVVQQSSKRVKVEKNRGSDIARFFASSIKD